MLKTKSLDARRFQLMALEHVLRRGKRAKKRREDLGLTQEDVAERIQALHAERNPDAPRDKTRGQMISDYERGVNDPRGARLELWAAALDWVVGDLEADRPISPSDDFSDRLREAEPNPELREVLESVARVEKRLAALEATLLAEIGQVRKAQEDPPSLPRTDGRKRGDRER
jgi:transcriptional regulator with XRE-family HTH domain